MRRRRLLIFLLPVAVVVVVVVVASRRQREPEYKGWKLSQWVLAFAGTLTGHRAASTGGPTRDEAFDAFSHIGTDGLPWVLRWIRYQPDPWRRKLFALATKLPPPLRFRYVDRSADLAAGGWYYLCTLGPRASPAIPALTRLINDPTSPERARKAVFALSSIGKGGIPPLVSLLGRPHAPNRTACVIAICSVHDLGTNTAPTVAALARCLHDPDAGLAAMAAWGLGNLAAEPEVAVPALAAAMQNPSTEVRNAAALAISRFGVGKTAE